MHKAAQRNDVAKLEGIRAVDEVDKGKRTALHWAVEASSHDAIDWLLKHGASRSGADKQGDTPTILAVKAGDTRSLQLLLDVHAQRLALLTAGDAKGMTALHWAVRLGDVEVLQLVLDVPQPGDKLALLSSKTTDGSTALHIACAEDCDEEVVTLLLDAARASGNAAAVVDARDASGRTPLGIAAAHGSAAVAKALMAAGANPLVRTFDGRSLLHLMAETGVGVADTVGTVLMEQLVTLPVDQRGRTALHWAALECHEDTCKELIAAGVDVSVVDADGKRAADFTARDALEELAPAAVTDAATAKRREKPAATKRRDAPTPVAPERARTEADHKRDVARGNRNVLLFFAFVALVMVVAMVLGRK